MIACKDLGLKSWGKIYTYGHGSSFCELTSLLSSGNRKLPSSTAIFNMASAHDCPSRKLGLCKAAKQGAKCYAQKTEYSYHPEVLPYRRKQEAFWKKTSAKEFVSQFLLLNALKDSPYLHLRFNESGDFHSQECVDKAEEIAKMLRRFGIRCYCYTSRDDLCYKNLRHLIVTGSNFTKPGISNVFRIVKSVKERKYGESVCKGNCRVCSLCLKKHLRIIAKKH